MTNLIYQRANVTKTEYKQDKWNPLVNRKVSQTVPRGVFTAHRTNGGRINVGWSLCNPKDKFNIDAGVDAAMQRSFDYINHMKQEMAPLFSRNAELQTVLTEQWNAFMERVNRYFKELPSKENPIGV